MLYPKLRTDSNTIVITSNLLPFEMGCITEGLKDRLPEKK